MFAGANYPNWIMQNWLPTTRIIKILEHVTYQRGHPPVGRPNKKYELINSEGKALRNSSATYPPLLDQMIRSRGLEENMSIRSRRAHTHSRTVSLNTIALVPIEKYHFPPPAYDRLWIRWKKVSMCTCVFVPWAESPIVYLVYSSSFCSYKRYTFFSSTEG